MKNTLEDLSEVKQHEQALLHAIQTSLFTSCLSRDDRVSFHAEFEEMLDTHFTPYRQTLEAQLEELGVSVRFARLEADRRAYQRSAL